ncbi:MAG: hypothetical protein K8L99_22005 [Anaerolineae bacterium]|nr:hypothetical protein [Anaerolineae bacterium]
MQRVADLTIEQLKELIDQRIQAALKSQDARTVQEILDSIDRNLWTPPSGAKSSRELLREDRDS